MHSLSPLSLSSGPPLNSSSVQNPFGSPFVTNVHADRPGARKNDSKKMKKKKRQLMTSGGRRAWTHNRKRESGHKGDQSGPRKIGRKRSGKPLGLGQEDTQKKLGFGSKGCRSGKRKKALGFFHSLSLREKKKRKRLMICFSLPSSIGRSFVQFVDVKEMVVVVVGGFATM
jgi:hypothetical protein